MIRPTCAPESARPIAHAAGGRASPRPRPCCWLRNGKLNSARPLRLARDAHERLGDRLRRRRPAWAASDVGVGRVVVARVGAAQHVHAAPSRAAACWRRPSASSSRAARVVVEHARAGRRASSGWRSLPRGRRGRRRCGVARPNSRPMPRAVVCGRSSPPLAASSSTKLEDLAVQLGAEVALREAERHRPAGAPVDLGHPVHLGARALVVGARALEARRDLVHAAPCRPSTSAIASSSRSSAHVPGTGRPSGTRCSSVRDVEKPSAPAAIASSTSSAHRRDVVVGCGLLVEAAFAHRVSGAARSGRPCRRR